MAKNLKIEVKGTEITVLDQSGEKYISLTDMLAVMPKQTRSNIKEH